MILKPILLDLGKAIYDSYNFNIIYTRMMDP